MQTQTFSLGYVPSLKTDKKLRRWWFGRRETKCAAAFVAVREAFKKQNG